MRRWRRVSRTIVVLSLIAVTFTASAAGVSLLVPSAALQPGSAGHILLMVFSVIMGLLAFAAAFNRLLVVPLIEKMASQHREFIADTMAHHKEFLATTLVEIGRGFDGLMMKHIEHGDPHPKASERMHGPLEAKLTDVSEKLDQLLIEHRIIRGSEDEVCKFVRQMARRDPANSPSPRRADDGPDFDATRPQPDGTPRLRGRG